MVFESVEVEKIHPGNVGKSRRSKQSKERNKSKGKQSKQRKARELPVIYRYSKVEYRKKKTARQILSRIWTEFHWAVKVFS